MESNNTTGCIMEMILSTEHRQHNQKGLIAEHSGAPYGYAGQYLGFGGPENGGFNVQVHWNFPVKLVAKPKEATEKPPGQTKSKAKSGGNGKSKKRA